MVRILSRGLFKLVGPGVDDGVLVEVIHGSHDAVLELLFGCDADVAQHRAGDLGEEALDAIKPLIDCSCQNPARETYEIRPTE